MDKKQVQAAIGRIDQVTAQLNMSRDAHIQLVNDIKLVQSVCEAYFKEEPKDGGTDKCPEHVEPGDENSQGGGDSV